MKTVSYLLTRSNIEAMCFLHQRGFVCAVAVGCRGHLIGSYSSP